MAAVTTTFLVVSGYRQEHVSQRNSASSAYQAQAYEQAQFYCFGKTGADREKCLSEQTEAAQAEQRSDYDLRAQQEMSEWALGVLVFSIFGFVVSSAGLVALVGTFHEQRKLARDQARPFLDQLGAVIDYSENPPAFFVGFYFFNAGDTPALNFFGDVRVEFQARTGPNADDTKDFSRPLTIMGGTILRGKSDAVSCMLLGVPPSAIAQVLNPVEPVYEEEPPAKGFTFTPERRAQLRVIGKLGYKDVFGRFHSEHVMYHVYKLRVGDRQVMLGSKLSFSPERVEQENESK